MTMENPVIAEWTLHQDGYTDIIVRKRFSGKYELLDHKDFYGGKRWKEINLPIDIIERDIARWGTKNE